MTEFQASAFAAAELRFHALHANGDGALDRTEVQGRGMSADTNGDGALTLDEVQAVRPGFSLQMYMWPDTNGDTQITQEGWQSRPAPRGGRGDRDAPRDPPPSRE